MRLHTPLVFSGPQGRHSALSATMGSTWAARRAGSTVASTPTAATSNVADTRTTGSAARTSYSVLARMRPVGYASANPARPPATATAWARTNVILNTSSGVAPNAKRIATSRTLWVIAYAMTPYTPIAASAMPAIPKSSISSIPRRCRLSDPETRFGSRSKSTGTAGSNFGTSARISGTRFDGFASVVATTTDSRFMYRPISYTVGSALCPTDAYFTSATPRTIGASVYGLSFGPEPVMSRPASRGFRPDRYRRASASLMITARPTPARSSDVHVRPASTGMPIASNHPGVTCRYRADGG